MTDTEARAKRIAHAALVAADYTHERLPFGQAELAARYAVEAHVKGWDHVPGSQATPDGTSWDDVPAALVVADEALAAIRHRHERFADYDGAGIDATTAASHAASEELHEDGCQVCGWTDYWPICPSCAADRDPADAPTDVPTAHTTTEESAR